MVKDALFILLKLRYDFYIVKWTGHKCTVGRVLTNVGIPVTHTS